MHRPQLIAVAILSIVAGLSSTNAGAETVAFTPDRWDLKDAAVQQHLGRRALSGTAWLKDVVFTNGIIEVDVATDRERSYPAIIFRRQADGDYEHVYLRPHRAGFYPDAVQYAPTFNGVAGWQLYSGPGFTAGVTLPENQWVHVRIEVLGTQARVFVGDAQQPTLAIPELERGSAGGGLGLQSPRGGSAWFSDFSYTSTDDLPFVPPETPEPVPGVISRWALSPTARSSGVAGERYLDGRSPADIAWLKVESEPSGLADVARFRRPRSNAISKVWARATLRADKKGYRPFAFGYSDDVSVYLNGQLLFTGRSGYRQRDPSFLGIIGWNDTIDLPLEKGDNDLVLSVADRFGGWGFMFRDMSAIYQDPGLRQVWELHDTLAAPESVVYDPAQRVLYVSSFGADFISKVGLDGRVIAPRWVSGLKAPTGLKLHAGRLYAVERPGVAVIDPEKAAIVARYAIPGAGFPNDLALDEAGEIYVTDSARDCIYRIHGGKAEVWVKGQAVANPNGILVETKRALVGVTSDGTIKAIDLKTKQVTTFLTLGPGVNMDGLVSDGKDGYLFSDYYGRIYHADSEGHRLLLLDRRGPHEFCADFERVPETGLLVVPSLYDQRLTAYTYELP